VSIVYIRWEGEVST